MSDRRQYITITLEDDLHEEFVQGLCKHLLYLRGVQKAEPGRPVDLADHLARERIFYKVKERLFKALDETLIKR